MEFYKNIPKPAKKRIALRVNAAAERSLRQGHPWIFENSITHQSHEGNPGDLAVIFDQKRRFLAFWFSIHLPILIGIGFWKKLIKL
jgi:23S rRNA (cytosine1962-C5)-methyltransferase